MKGIEDCDPVKYQTFGSSSACLYSLCASPYQRPWVLRSSESFQFRHILRPRSTAVLCWNVTLDKGQWKQGTSAESLLCFLSLCTHVMCTELPSLNSLCFVIFSYFYFVFLRKQHRNNMWVVVRSSCGSQMIQPEDMLFFSGVIRTWHKWNIYYHIYTYLSIYLSMHICIYVQCINMYCTYIYIHTFMYIYKYIYIAYIIYIYIYTYKLHKHTQTQFCMKYSG